MAVNVVKKYCTENDCYKSGAKRGNIVGLIVHTPAVIEQGNTIKALSESGSGGGWYRRWNRAGVEKLADGVIDDTGVYDFAPHTLACWHVGTSYGNAHFIGYEFCETLSRAEFNQTWNNAVEHYAELCSRYGLTEKNIYGHYEAHEKGWASDHSDPAPYFRRFGKSMADFRADVKKLLIGRSGSGTAAPVITKTYDPWAYAKVAGLTADDPYLNVRTGPGIEYDIIRKLGNGNEVDVLELYSNGWARINIIDRQYYVYSGYLVITEKGQADITPAYTEWAGRVHDTDPLGLIVRTGPGKNYGRLESYPKLYDGNMVSVMGEENGYYHIRISSPKTGTHIGYGSKVYIERA